MTNLTEAPKPTTTSNDKCDLNCQNGGKCVSLIDEIGNDEYCECPNPFWGKYCEQSSACELDCLNGGYCRKSPGDKSGQFCYCPGFEGRHCQFQTPTKEDCDAAITCQNGGTCCSANVEPCLFGDENPYFIPEVKYYCNCPVGFGGDQCEILIEDPCDQTCLNGGHCEIHYLMDLNEETGPQWCSATRPGGCTDGDCMYPSHWYEKRCACPETSQGQFCEEINVCGCKNNGYCMNKEQSRKGNCRVQCMGKSGKHKESCHNKCMNNDGDDDVFVDDEHGESSCQCEYQFFGAKCEHAVTTVCPKDDKAKEMHEGCMNGLYCSQDTLQQYFGERYCANGGSCGDENGVFQCDCSTQFEGNHCEVLVTSSEQSKQGFSSTISIAVIAILIVIILLVATWNHKSKKGHTHKLIVEMTESSDLELEVYDTEIQ